MNLARLLVFILLLPATLPAAVAFQPLPSDRSFQRPVALVSDPAAPDELYVVEQDGRLWSLKAGKTALVHDLRPKVRTDNNEEGLLCAAFHPGGKAKGQGRYYAIYSVRGAKPRRTRLSEFRRGSKQERILLEVTKRWGNHNGATLAFGPDGCLYISLGDGGSGGDPDDNAQNLKSLLGKILRIDVDRKDPGLEYAVPKDNPWAGKPDARGEIWAYGLRNPWRMAFDSATGALWAGDVGQDEREELDLIVKGGNYGWNFREGKVAYGRGGGSGPFLDPAVDYGRRQGFSITGGPVARGKAPKSLLGRVLYADFGSRRLWSLDTKITSRAQPRVEGDCPEAPSSFGTDLDGRVYVVGYGGGLYRLEDL